MTTGTDAVLRGFIEMIAPLHAAVASPEALQRFFYDVGYRLEGLDVVFERVDAFSELGERTRRVVDLLDGATEDGFGMEDWPAVLAAVTAVVDGVRLLREIGDDLQGITDLVHPLNEAGFWRDLAEDIPSYLVVSYLKFTQPKVYATLRLVGVIDRQPSRLNGNGRLRTAVVWSRLPDLLSDPPGTIAAAYNWDGAADAQEGFEYAELVNNLGLLGSALMARSRYLPLDPALRAELFGDVAVPGDLRSLTLPLFAGPISDGSAYAEAGLKVVPLPDPVRSSISAVVVGGFAIVPYASGRTELNQALTPDGSVALRGTLRGDLGGAVRVEVLPSGIRLASSLDAIAAGSSARFDLVFSGGTEAPRIVLFGKPDATNLSIRSLSVGLGVEEGDFYVAAGISDFTLTVDVGDDGLLARFIPAPIVASLGEVVAGWREGRGVYLEGGGPLSLFVPLSLTLGPVRLYGVGLEFAFSPDKRLTAWINGDLTIGPLFLGVEGLGLHATFTADEGDANPFGAFDVAISPRFPTGYVASLDCGVVAGGGALIHEEYDYKGALALKFQNFSLSAFGILSTRMPDGKPGFSFLASVFGGFSVALGYGFFLTGVGGIIGINRTTDIEALRAVLFEGRLDSVLFPSSPLTDATIILNDLAASFPVAEGQHLFGPMVRIGWGVPTLIEGKVGLIIEVGGTFRLVLLGSVGLALPDRDAAIVSLWIDFLGYVDFDSGEISFDAAITNSRILTWPISGEAAVRTGWGKHAGLVAAVGGLHPQYPQPAGFPSLQRLTLSLGVDNPRITLTAYHAITTNSFQLGADAQLYVDAGSVPLVGRVEVKGWAGFNALIVFDPFAFDVALSLGLCLLVDGTIVCGIGGDLRLRGPNVFIINGKVWVTVFGIDVKVAVDKRWGTARPAQVSAVSALDALSAALSARPELEVVQTSARTTGVSFTPHPGYDGPALHDPTHGLRVRQLAVPLDATIQKMGNAPLADNIRRVDVQTAYDDGTPATLEAATCEFARAHYFTSTDDEMLREPAFETFKSGVALTDASGFVFHRDSFETLSDEYEYVHLESGTASSVRGGVAPHRLGALLDRAYAAGMARQLAQSGRTVVNQRAQGLDGQGLIAPHRASERAIPVAAYIAESVFGEPT